MDGCDGATDAREGCVRPREGRMDAWKYIRVVVVRGASRRGWVGARTRRRPGGKTRAGTIAPIHSFTGKVWEDSTLGPVWSFDDEIDAWWGGWWCDVMCV